MTANQEEVISVVMPVHNALPYLDQAIESILNQSLSDFEFVILDDASTDGSTGRLLEWAAKDPRIKLVRSARNLGVVASSNRVVEEASGNIIARMDADDVVHPHRLERQVAVLREHPEVGLVGTLSDTIDAKGRMLRGPEIWRVTRRSFQAPFPHGSITYRRELFERVGGYRAACEYWEDQDLYLRMARMGRIMVICEALYQVRHSPTSTRVASDQRRVELAVDLMYRSMSQLNASGSFEHVLGGGPGVNSRIDPRVFISLGSLALWSGKKPHLFRRLLSRGRLRANAPSAAALVWTAWASLSPVTLRTFLKLLMRSRNRFVTTMTPEGDPIAWEPPTGPAGTDRCQQGAIGPDCA